MEVNVVKGLKISENGRFLVTNDDEPFFWLADTGWELFHKLSIDEAVMYLKNRAEKGFNVIQAVALAEDSGLAIPNASGRFPLLKNEEGLYDPTMPDTYNGEGPSYWDDVDRMIKVAGELGLYVGFLPTWGDKFNLLAWGKGPEIFNGNNARTYGRWLGQRYKDYPNIIWIMGGDRPLNTANHFEIVNNMAEGIREGDCGKHLMTFHPCGFSSSSLHMHDEKWLDFNMVQSGHGMNVENYTFIESDYARLPTKPVLDGEPRYEDHPIAFKANNGFFDDFDVRQAAYWSVLAGACGHTYGHHSIWKMCTEPDGYFIMTWEAALDRPGASQMKYLKMLINARPFTEGIPDQSILVDNPTGAIHMQALRGSDYLYVYSPYGLKIKVQMGKITGRHVRASWFNPRNGTYTLCGVFENNGISEFLPPSSGRNNDWVLVLEDTSKR